MSFVYGYFEILNLKPYGIHYWRQSDCLAFAGNYYQQDLSLIKPEIYWLGNTSNGAAASEFPVLYYLTAKIWNITGQNDKVLRLINIFIVFTGLFFLLKIFTKQTGLKFWSLLSVMLLFTSPMLVFYTNNFLPDAPAFALALIGLFFAWNYYTSFKIKHLYLTALFFLLAGLIKISSLIGLFALLPIHIYILFFDKAKRVKYNTLIPFLLIFTAIAAWYYYAFRYNSVNLEGVFRQGISPVWEYSNTQRNEIFEAFKKDIFPLFFNVYALGIMGILLLLTIVLVKHTNKFLLAYFAFLLFGTIGYFTLFYVVFDAHDYYLVNILIIIPAFLLLFLDFANRSFNFINNKFLKIALSVITALLILLTAQINRQKYFSADEDFLVKNGIYEVDQKWEWNHYDYKKRFKALESIRPYLQEIGIKPEEKIISIPDPTPNYSLYLMGHKGWSDYDPYNKDLEYKFKRSLKYGAEYLVVNDTVVFSERKYLEKYRNNLVGKYENVYIYRLN